MRILRRRIAVGLILILFSGCAGHQTLSGVVAPAETRPHTTLTPSSNDLQTSTIEPLPGFYTTQVPLSGDLYELLLSGEVVQFDTVVRNENWMRPSEEEQREKIWLKRPFVDLPDKFLRWWFTQPAVLYDGMDILQDMPTDDYDFTAPRSDWLALLGVWTTWDPRIKGSWQNYETGYAAPSSPNDYLEGRTIEVWLMGYEPIRVTRVGEQYFVEVSEAKGFKIIRFAGHDSSFFQIHVIDYDRGQEIVRLPRLCRSPENPDCSQPEQPGLFVPSPTPTRSPYIPGPTPAIPSLDDLEIINLDNLQEIQLIGRYDPKDPLDLDNVSSFAISPDSETIAFSAKDGIDLWSLETENIVKTIAIDSGKMPSIGVLHFSPDGKKLADLSEDIPRVWDIFSGELISRLDRADIRGYSDVFTAIAFSPDSRMLVTTSMEAWSDTRIWSVQTGDLIQDLGMDNQLDIAFSPDGKRFFTVDRLSEYENSIHAWDWNTWKEIGAYPVVSEPTDIQIDPTGELVAINALWTWDSATITCIYQLDEWKELGCLLDKDQRSLFERAAGRLTPSFSLGGEVVAFATGEGEGTSINTIKFWNSWTQEQMVILRPLLPAPITQAKFSPNGKLFVARCDDGTAFIWGVPAN